MNINAYLQRIHFNGVAKNDQETLFQLQRQHLLTIPFENLDIHYNNTIVLDTKKFYTKIIVNKRGGFCYELNGLFGTLLTHLGFDVTLVSARVHIAKDTYGEEFDPMALMANIGDKNFLTDVGFGAFSMQPLEFVLDQNDIVSIF